MNQEEALDPSIYRRSGPQRPKGELEGTGRVIGSEGGTAERRRWRDEVIKEYEEWMRWATWAAGAVGVAFWMVEALQWYTLMLWILPIMFGVVYPSTSLWNMVMIMVLCLMMFASLHTLDGFLTLFFFHSDTLTWLLRHYYSRTTTDLESQPPQPHQRRRLFPITSPDPHLRHFLLRSSSLLLKHLLLLLAAIALSIPLFLAPPSSVVVRFIHVFASFVISFVALGFVLLCAIFWIAVARRSPDGSILLLFMSLVRSSHVHRDGWSAALAHFMNVNPVRIFDFAYQEVLIPATWATGADRPSFEEMAGAYTEMLRYLYAHRNGESDVVTRIKSGRSDEREVGAWMVGFWVSSEMKREVRSLRYDLLEELLNISRESKAAEGSVSAVLKSKPELMPDDLLRRIIASNDGVYPRAIVEAAKEYDTMKKKKEKKKKKKI